MDDLTHRAQAALAAAVQRGALPDLHGVLVSQRGKLRLESYFAGPDERMGQPLGVVTFGPGVSHDLRSVTKSVVSLLFGCVALEHRLDVHAPLHELLPSRRGRFGDAARALTLEHVLTMTMGLEWDESISYADPRNAERQMAAAEDRVDFVLALPRAEEPGRRWHYCGGATELLAAIIEELTQLSLERCARERIFEPLGLNSVEWMGDSKGPYAASGLRMLPAELARIGQLVLQQGEWQGRTLIPSTWFKAALTPHVPIGGPVSYGYHFFTGTLQAGARTLRFHAGFGNGGQHLYVVPEVEAVVVITAGLYNEVEKANTLAIRVMRELLGLLVG